MPEEVTCTCSAPFDYGWRHIPREAHAKTCPLRWRRFLVTGSRDVLPWSAEWKAVEARLKTLPRDSIIIHGAAPGVDACANQYGIKLGFKRLPFPAHWRHRWNCPPDCNRKTGNAAGPIRNQQMIDEGHPEYVIAFPRRSSKGTYDMIERTQAAGLPYEVIYLD